MLYNYIVYFSFAHSIGEIFHFASCRHTVQIQFEYYVIKIVLLFGLINIALWLHRTLKIHNSTTTKWIKHECGYVITCMSVRPDVHVIYTHYANRMNFHWFVTLRIAMQFYRFQTRALSCNTCQTLY